MNECRSCKSGNLKTVFDLGDVYLSEFRNDKQLPPKSPLTLELCLVCGLVQLSKSVDPDLIFTDDYGFESGVNNTVKADLAEIVTRARELVDLNVGDVVIDIGCNDGTLLSYYKNDPVIKIGVDPVVKFVEKSTQHANFIIPTFFDAELVKERVSTKAKIITSISMFYDLEDPGSFCEGIVDLLHDDGVWVVQQNYLGAMLKQNAYDNVVHQHVEYYSMAAMTHLLARYGLRVFRAEQNNVNGGSFRTFICKDKSKFATEANVYMLENDELESEITSPERFKKFEATIKRLSHNLFDLINEKVNDGKSIYIYGASTRGDTLLQVSGLTNKMLPFAVERNPDKVGKIISSLQIPIISEKQAREEKPDYMLVLPWFFFNEFQRRESEYVMNGGKFILPLPEVNVYGVGIIHDH